MTASARGEPNSVRPRSRVTTRPRGRSRTATVAPAGTRATRWPAGSGDGISGPSSMDRSAITNSTPRTLGFPTAMKVGIVVPYSWSFWGGVPEHAHHQALALRKLGVETRTLMGNDPPGQFTRVLHP